MHARKRTAQIYDMADTVAELRLERNQMLANAARRAEGASRAKAMRIKKKASKKSKASVLEEQTLVAKLGIYCDLVLMGEESWEQYHTQLELGGQKQAVVESMGGGISSSQSAKAWKAAETAAFKPNPKRRRRIEITRPPGPRKRYPCYYCNVVGHRGKYCPDKKAGKPCHPQSRQAKWNKEKAEKEKAAKAKEDKKT